MLPVARSNHQPRSSADDPVSDRGYPKIPADTYGNADLAPDAVAALDHERYLVKWGILDVFMFLVFMSILAYLLIAMKYFYGQRWFKTVIKFLMVSVLSLVMMLVLFILFSIFSAVTI